MNNDKCPATYETHHITSSKLTDDIMDVDKKEFDDDFYEFRTCIKSLERRLASCLVQAFDDCSTITAQFKLLDSFERLLERRIVSEELEKSESRFVVKATKEYLLETYARAPR